MTDLLQATPGGIARAAELLRSGEVVAFPTDTVYGVGIPADHGDRLELLFALKDRPVDRRIALLVTGLSQATDAGWVADGRAHRLADRFWPGGLTLVLPSPDGTATQGFRAPDHPVTLELLRQVGPIFATSANISDQPDTLGADDVLIAFATRQDELAAVVDGGRVPGGVASTVVDLSVAPARVVREGPIERNELAEAVDLAP